MPKRHRVLTIFPKTSSTVIGVFLDETCIYKETIEHMRPYITNEHQIEREINVRKADILQKISEAGINISKLDAICASGGLLKPVEGGTYIVSKEMINDLISSYSGKHASNLGGILASEIATKLNITAYIVDPPVVNEMEHLAKYSGLPAIERKSIFHALNQKAVARQTANELNKVYEQTSLIIAHLGNGITVGAHQNGKVIDVNNGLHGDGPFSYERAGSLPIEALITLCYSGKYNEAELIKKITYQSGLKAYFKTDNLDEIFYLLNKKDNKLNEITEAMAYQIAKEIAAMASVLKGHVEAIVLTGEFAQVANLTTLITERVNWIADILIYPGEHDLQALNSGALRVLRNEEEPKIYK